MKKSQSTTTRWAVVAAALITACAPAMADPAIVQTVAMIGSFVFPQFAIPLLLASPAVLGSASRRKKDMAK